MLAWQRSAIALMGFGFVVERFGLFLQLVAHQSLSGSQRSFSLGLGVLLLLLGAAVALISARQFHPIAKSLDPAVASGVLDPCRRQSQYHHRRDFPDLCPGFSLAGSLREYPSSVN